MSKCKRSNSSINKISRSFLHSPNVAPPRIAFDFVFETGHRSFDFLAMRLVRQSRGDQSAQHLLLALLVAIFLRVEWARAGVEPAVLVEQLVVHGHSLDKVIPNLENWTINEKKANF